MCPKGDLRPFGSSALHQRSCLPWPDMLRVFKAGCFIVAVLSLPLSELLQPRCVYMYCRSEARFPNDSTSSIQIARNQPGRNTKRFARPWAIRTTTQMRGACCLYSRTKPSTDIQSLNSISEGQANFKLHLVEKTIGRELTISERNLIVYEPRCIAW